MIFMKFIVTEKEKISIYKNGLQIRACKKNNVTILQVIIMSLFLTMIQKSNFLFRSY
jgi:hypothetical protein